MKKYKKVMIYAGATLLIVLCVFVGYIYFFQPIRVYEPEVYSFKGEANLKENLSVEEIKGDVKELINIVEETHPIFLDKKSDKYELAKANFMDSCNKDMSTEDFQLEISKYLSSLEDGHTRIKWSEERVLDINWLYIDGKLKLLDENDKITDKEVVKINDKEVNTLIVELKKIFPAENYVAESKNITTKLKGSLVLKSLGLESEDKTIIKVKGEDKLEDMEVKYISMDNNVNSNYDISSKEIDNKTFYIKLGICEINDNLNSVNKSLENAIQNGTKNVIIDVRGNPGGNSTACSKLLDTMGMEPGNFGAVIRFSPLAQRQLGYLRKNGKVILSNSNKSKRNEDIKLYIITNEDTFSSAQWLATFVQDGELGTIVGSASSNMPSSYGDIIRFQLSNSNIEGSVSHKKFTRPDSSKDEERTLEPDIKVKYGEDSLEKLLDYIKE